jgi:hypothetical protein
MPAPKNDPLDLLKWRLLLRRLEDTPDNGLHAQIMREADRALTLSRAAGFPFLTFPCLFEERAGAVAEAAQRQSSRYWGELVSGSPPGSGVIVVTTVWSEGEDSSVESGVSIEVKPVFRADVQPGYFPPPNAV